MAPHEEFLELCAAAIAGELTTAEQAKLDAHLAVCSECRWAIDEYKTASVHGVAALASELAPVDVEVGSFWSVEEAERTFFQRLETEKKSATGRTQHEDDIGKRGQ